jgi:hypothetical protein
MKYVLIPILAVLLGGCANSPARYGDRESGYSRGNGNYLYRDYNDGHYPNYGYHDEHGNRGDPAGIHVG